MRSRLSAVRFLRSTSKLISFRTFRFGFTLIEVLVVLGITSLLAGMILTYTSTSRDRTALYVEEAKLAQTISRAKALGIATFTANGTPPCGYGLKVDYDAQSYSVFSYRADSCDIQVFGLGATMENVSTDQLSPNVRFAEPGEGSVEVILFVPPDPKTWVWHIGSAVTSTAGSITLKTATGNSELTIQVNSAGQITF